MIDYFNEPNEKTFETKKNFLVWGESESYK